MLGLQTPKVRCAHPARTEYQGADIRRGSASDQDFLTIE